jgi:hypothetical protein
MTAEDKTMKEQGDIKTLFFNFFVVHLPPA